jgi:phosphatidylserine synthase
MRTSQSPAGCLHVSNALTYASLCAGMAAVACAQASSAGGAAACIAAAVIADTFDGRFARLFNRDDDRRAFGAGLDSLSDAVSFGAAPPICLSVLSRPPEGMLAIAWWAAGFVYGACAITRLGFFNISHDRYEGFIGLPAPVAALVLASGLLGPTPPAVSIVRLLATAVAMIGPWKVPRPVGLGLALFVLWPTVIILAPLVRP